VALITANLINAGASWVLVYGGFGIPALGVAGSGYATTIARIYMAMFLVVVILLRERRRPSGLHDVPFVVEAERMWRLVRLGLPAALQMVLEVGVFATASALAARITPTALAANQIVLNVASFFFMVHFGLSSAAAVRVGQAVGRDDRTGVRLAGWVALGLSLGYSVGGSILFVTIPDFFLRLFTNDAALLTGGASLLLIYALLQPFDGAQSVATGALRGLGDTRTPMLLNLAGHWFIGLPIAYVLCFSRQWGVEGLWAGLGFGILLIAIVLVAVWRQKSGASAPE